MATFLVVLLLAGCGEGVTELGHGYKLISLDSANWCIADGHQRIVVDPNVSHFRVLDPYVVGERDDANIDERNSRHYGFFIFDMRDRSYVEGMDKRQFEDALHKRGLCASSWSNMFEWDPC
jgi:hypothetical protein